MDETIMWIVNATVVVLGLLLLAKAIYLSGRNAGQRNERNFWLRVYEDGDTK